jgi:hypothetical protein
MVEFEISHCNASFGDRIRREVEMGVLLMITDIPKHRSDVHNPFFGALLY